MRYRWVQLMNIEGERDFWEKKFVLWLDFSIYFPYAYESSEAYVSLEGEGIQILKRTKLVSYANIDYQHIIPEQSRRADGIPYVFSDWEQLEKIERITVTVIYSYRNGMGEHIKVIVRHTENVRFWQQDSLQDYLIQKQLTTVPALLEGDELGTQRKIISCYGEILQAMVDLKHICNPFFLNSIRSVSNMEQKNAVKLVDLIIKELAEQGMLKETDRCILNLLYDTDIDVIQPLIEHP